MANTRWKIGKRNERNGQRTVRTRVNGILIGSISYGPSSKQWYAWRSNGETRQYKLQHDACAWLMQGFDAQEENRS